MLSVRELVVSYTQRSGQWFGKRVTRVVDIIAGREHERGADFVIVYAAEVRSGILTAGDDADDVRWFERSSLPPLAFKATRVVLNGRDGDGSRL